MHFQKLACSPKSLHAVPWASIQLHKLACSFMSLHAVPWACMQFHELAYRYIDFHIVQWACLQFHFLASSSIQFHISSSEKLTRTLLCQCLFAFTTFGFIRSSGFHNVCVCCVDHSQRGSGSTFYEYEYSQCQFFEHFGSWSTLKLAIMLHWDWYWLNMNICMYKFDIVTEYCDSRESIQMQTKS